MYIQTRPADY